MWARVVEIMLGLWMALSPIIFYTEGNAKYRSWCCAFLIILFAALSFWRRTKRAHLLSLGVSLWLFTAAYASFPQPASPLEQNGFFLAFLWMMTALIPTDASDTPALWKRH